MRPLLSVLFGTVTGELTRDICGLILVDAMDNLGICADDMFEADEVDRNLSVELFLTLETS